MYNMSDYRAALSERGNYDMDSADWKLAQQKVQSIVAVLVAAGDKAMVGEVVEEVYSLNDCGCSMAVGKQWLHQRGPGTQRAGLGIGIFFYLQSSQMRVTQEARKRRNEKGCCQ